MNRGVKATGAQTMSPKLCITCVVIAFLVKRGMARVLVKNINRGCKEN